MTRYDKKLFQAIVTTIGSESAVYGSIRRMERKFPAIKPEILLYLVAADRGLKVSKFTKSDDILSQVDDLLQRHRESKKENTKPAVVVEKKLNDIDPYSLPLSKYGLNTEIASECRIRKPYSKEINHAILNLEVFMRRRMDLPETVWGRDLVKEARKYNVFKRENPGEEDGLYFLFTSAMLWLKNAGGHRKRNATREDCLKIILFVDYLISLFDSLCKKNFDTRS